MPHTDYILEEKHKNMIKKTFNYSAPHAARHDKRKCFYIVDRLLTVYRKVPGISERVCFYTFSSKCERWLILNTFQISLKFSRLF